MAKRAAVEKPVRPITPAEVFDWLKRGDAVFDRLPPSPERDQALVNFRQMAMWLSHIL